MSKETPRTEKCIDRSKPTNRCSNCGHEFAPEDSRSVLIRAGEVYCGCPECGCGTPGITLEEITRSPVVGVDHLSYFVSEEQGTEYTTVGIVFSNHARLQYRE